MVMEFKNLKTETFENVKIKGMYESKLKPIQLILNVSFSLIPIKGVIPCEEFKKHLKKKLSLFAIDRSCKELLQSNWSYDGSRFTYEHDLNSVKLDSKQICSLGVDLNFIQINTNASVKEFYKIICPEIAKIKSFKTEDFITIQSNRKNKNVQS
jgi:hypothetical protein